VTLKLAETSVVKSWLSVPYGANLFWTKIFKNEINLLQAHYIMCMCGMRNQLSHPSKTVQTKQQSFVLVHIANMSIFSVDEQAFLFEQYSPQRINFI